MKLKNPQREHQIRKKSMPYVTSEMRSIIDHVEQILENTDFGKNLHFSPTVLTGVRRVMMSNGTIITDTPLAQSDVDARMAEKLNVRVHCFLDDPKVVELAAQKKITRAEIALDHVLSLDGMKLLVIGSAPMALDRLLKRRQREPIHDLVVLAMPTGFAGVLQLKERLWESDIPCIVARGKSGGIAASVAVLNALMAASIREQNL